MHLVVDPKIEDKDNVSVLQTSPRHGYPETVN